MIFYIFIFKVKDKIIMNIFNLKLSFKKFNVRRGDLMLWEFDTCKPLNLTSLFLSSFSFTYKLEKHVLRN